MKPAQVLLGEDVVERLDALHLGPCLQTLADYSYPVPFGYCWSGDRYVECAEGDEGAENAGDGEERPAGGIPETSADPADLPGPGEG